MGNNKIYVYINKDYSAMLEFPEYNIKTKAYIGENGYTDETIEGDKKTLLGEFELGLAIGTHSEEEMKNKLKIEYTKITDSMYWVDDPTSQYYNQLMDTNKTEKTWKSAEHLIDFPVDYELGVEIKINPNNIPYKGSAVFLHCNTGEPTWGCVGVSSEDMRELIQYIDKDTKIVVKLSGQ